MANQIKIRRDGLLMRVFPLTKRVEAALCSRLTYTRSKFLATVLERRQAGGRTMIFTKVRCYQVITVGDGPGSSRQLVTNAGYFRRVVSILRALDYEPEVRDERPLGRAGAFAVREEVVAETGFRPHQKEILLKMLRANRGQIHYPTGAGKSFVAQIVCQALPKARIIFTTKHQAVLKEAYAALRGRLPSVGIYCSDVKQNVGARVMCCSAGSLHKAAEWRPDLIIGDETHELATEHLLEKLSQFTHCRFLGLSANHEDRMDGVDFELEGLFGPVIATLEYEDAVRAGLVVPIRVYWRHVRGSNPIAGATKRIVKQRYGFWRHRARNLLIARDARLFPEDQVLIVVKTVEHAVCLGALLPEFKLCYSTMKPEQLLAFQQQGLLPSTYRPLDKKGLDALKAGFEAGTARKVIATSVWNRGVNFHKLSTLIRAGGGASKLDDTQIPGRLSRLGKSYGRLIDYWDEFDDECHEQALSRFRQYRRKKWQQIEPEDDPLLHGGSASTSPLPAPSRRQPG